MYHNRKLIYIDFETDNSQGNTILGRFYIEHARKAET